MKNQLKKSLSLLMAVLMILSCWVWVAPEKASAAKSGYDVTIYHNVVNGCEEGKVTIWYKPNNGIGDELSKEYALDNIETDGGPESTTITDVPGWPSKIQFYVKNDASSYTWGSCQCEITFTKVVINERTVLTCDGPFNWSQSAWTNGYRTRTYYPTNDAGTSGVAERKDGDADTNYSFSWPKPTLFSIDTINAENVTLNKLGGESVTSGMALSGTDSYNVEWTAAIPYSAVDFRIYYEDAEGKEYNIDSQYANITTASGIKVNLEPEIQTLFPDTNEFDSDGNSKFLGKGTIFVGANYNKNEVSTGIEMTFPTYTASFYPNGGTIGTSAVNNTSDDSKPIVIGGEGEDAHKLYYGSIIGTGPVYAQREGMTFAGYYSYPNEPLTGRYGSFTGTKYNEDDEYTTVGTGGDSHWYAAWESTKINATFMVGDQLLGTLEGRYDNSMLGKNGNMYGTEAQINNELYNAYTKDAIEFDANNNPVLYINGQKNVFNGWQIIDYKYDETQIYKGDLSTILYGDVTFGAKWIPASDITESKYTVTFYSGNIVNGNLLAMASNVYPYRAQVTLPSTEPTKAQDQKYTYEFAGWAEYIGSPYYAVDENSYTEDGAYIHYTPKETAEFIATKTVGYVPVFKMVPREYKVTFITLGDGGVQNDNVVVEGYHYEDNITVPETIKDSYTQAGRRYYINGWKIGTLSAVKAIEDITVTGDMILTASYDKTGVLAEYTIRFFDKDGNLINGDNYIYQHNTTVTAPSVGDAQEGDGTAYDIPYTIDTEDSLYTFSGWSPSVNTTATADVDYKAEYSQKDYADVYFYNYDGTLLYKLDGKENSNFEEDVIPAYSQALPERAEDVRATYKFTGWKDGDGKAVVPGSDKLTGDMHLTAQYAETLKTYTVLFLNGDEVVSRETYTYGEALREIPATATKDPDDYNSYSFKAWEPAVSEVCYGDATYNATFRKSAILYDIYWLAENTEDTIRHSRYAYGTRIQPANAPAESVLLGDAAEGYIWAFKEWVRCNEYGKPLDAEGNIVDEAYALKFERGMTMPKETLYFYPTYEQDATKIMVEFYEEDGTTLIGKATVPYNGVIDDYANSFVEDAAKPSTPEYHFDFAKWVNLDGTELPKNAEGKYIVDTADGTVKKVKASYTAGAHNYVEYELIVAPSCTETGVVTMKCDSPYCDRPTYEEILDIIPDDNAPTAQVYMGTHKWTMTDYILGNINYDEKIYVSADTATIVNAEDLGTVSKQNPLAKLSRGVGKIDYYVSETVLTDPAKQVSVWNNIYDYSRVYNEVLASVLKDKGYTMSEYEDAAFAWGSTLKTEVDNEVKAILATYNANATGMLGELGLENGKEYVIYLRVSDREVNGDVNISYLSTGTLHYGTQAATITITGDGYGSKFCEEATVRISDDTDGFTIYLDGVDQKISATSTSVNGTSAVSFKNSTVGVHTVTVVDKNGNRSTKTFEIKGGHTYRNYTIAQNCENDGSRYDLCTICGVKANEQVLTKLGHNYKTFTEKAPTCTVDGYRTYVCDNNCGTTLSVGPELNTDKLASCGITAEDIKHLDATGVHTYPMVIGEDGKETTEEAWVIDKAATCVAEGAKHRDCTKCGYREAVEIEIDDDAHKFYRARIEKGDEPTCTEGGIRTETCRYCGYKNTVEELAPLGHTAGEYKVTLEATCTEAGSKILTCAVCKTDIGEAHEDENGNVTFDGKAVVIPALGHAYKAVNDPVYNAEDGKWYQHYVCANDASHTKDVETEHEEKIEATVTFISEDTTVKTITKYAGETIIATDVSVPAKDADATYKYTFSNWATRTGAGTEADPYVYTAVEFPITVTEADATYYAVFAKKNVKYTVTYLNEDGTQYKKVGYINNGTVVELADGPAKAETVYKSFEFAGWAQKVEKTEADGQVTDGNAAAEEKTVVEFVPVGDTVTINGESVVLYATYTAKDRKYAVTYANSMTDTIESFLVQAGSEARPCGLTPEKVSDSKYHYTFSSWNRANQLTHVTSNVYTTPDFTSEAHKFRAVVVTPATCTSYAVVKKVCDTCNYETATYEDKTNTIGHNWTENAVYDEATGKYIRSCQNQGCTATTADTRTFTFNFFYEAPVDETVKPNREVSNIAWGTTVDASRLPSDPEKEADDQYIYTFKGWKLKGDTDDKLQELEKIVVKQDYDFVAVFDKAVREYTVTFAYEYSHKPIKVYTVKYGAGVVYDGTTPVKENDTDPNYDPENYHYTFKEWSAKTDKIAKNTVVYAKFTKAEHTYGAAVETGPATCQQGTGYKYTCTLASCQHVKYETGKPLAHNLEVIENVSATPDKDGYIKRQCTYVYDGKRCEYTETEILKYEDSTVKVIVTVDRDGNPAANIKVITHAIGEDATKDASTNVNGVATIVVEKDKTYAAYVEIDGEMIPVSLVADSNGNFIGVYSIVTNNNNTDDTDCGCACHRDNFWGTIFRFFHKIIKLFTGEFKCCGNPDPMYG